ncbi:hypothetical protein PENCOP_c006G01068 [Penicillium coprophilum]|uniref:Secreted protein CSS2 C-terminal domain-containing protein n=1 Tax=Penicillium coprophilum TaxID=36646 RepID=A0A1V6UN28_9EURO|nr:hypothetical protein PENCOP_c006G01068 [Penicillium coprophilum]
MPSLSDRLLEIARFCCLSGLIILNGLYRYVLSEDSDYSTLLLNTRDLENALIERTPVQVCERIVATTAACAVITNFAVALYKSLASTIKELSDQGDCNLMRGTSETLKWSYKSSGRNCDTKAQHDTISGAIKKYMADMEHEKICGTHCLRLDYGGTWDGWLNLGPVNSFNDGAYCGPELDFVSCLLGGNNDIYIYKMFHHSTFKSTRDVHHSTSYIYVDKRCPSA